MTKTEFKAYAIDTGYDGRLGGYKVDHVFVVSGEGHDWNCFGRGKDVVPQARLIACGSACAKWADLIAGPDKAHPTGLTERFDGVCHNAANRLLVLAGCDVTGALGSELATLMYGKYGFNIAGYVERVRSAADAANAKEPGAIPQDEVEAVVSRITRDAGDELLILKADFEEAAGFDLGTLPCGKKDALAAIYRDLHERRHEVFERESANNNRTDFQGRYCASMRPVLLKALRDAGDALGPETYQALFKLMPEDAARFLLGQI